MHVLLLRRLCRYRHDYAYKQRAEGRSLHARLDSRGYYTVQRNSEVSPVEDTLVSGPLPAFLRRRSSIAWARLSQ